MGDVSVNTSDFLAIFSDCVMDIFSIVLYNRKHKKISFGVERSRIHEGSRWVLA